MRVETQYPIAHDSLDHLYPEGTKNDNNTSLEFIQQLESYFNNKQIKLLDLGCAGGQFVVDMYNRGHEAIGLEGSDYSLYHKRANWPEYHNKNLFTCDISRPFKVLSDNDEQVLFDCITAWELIEHIPPNRSHQFFTSVLNHMHDKSIFCGSIAFHKSPSSTDCNIELHQSIFLPNIWNNIILPRYFNVLKYPFSTGVRGFVNTNEVYECTLMIFLTKKG